jgi:hypothetical protein
MPADRDGALEDNERPSSTPRHEVSISTWFFAVKVATPGNPEKEALAILRALVRHSAESVRQLRNMILRGLGKFLPVAPRDPLVFWCQFSLLSTLPALLGATLAWSFESETKGGHNAAIWLRVIQTLQIILVFVLFGRDRKYLSVFRAACRDGRAFWISAAILGLMSFIIVWHLHAGFFFASCAQQFLFRAFSDRGRLNHSVIVLIHMAAIPALVSMFWFVLDRLLRLTPSRMEAGDWKLGEGI